MTLPCVYFQNITERVLINEAYWVTETREVYSVPSGLDLTHILVCLRNSFLVECRYVHRLGNNVEAHLKVCIQ